MSAFCGKLIKGEQVVLDSVVGTLRRYGDGWAGQFVLPQGVTLDVGEYRLVLGNGMEGKVVIGMSTWEALPTSMIVPFEGAGPLQQPRQNSLSSA